jgi:hypothetical protein
LEIIYSDGRFQALSDDYTDYTEIILLDRTTTEEVVVEGRFIEDESVTILTSDNYFIKIDLFDMTKIQFERPECLLFNSPQTWIPISDDSIVFALNSSIYKITSSQELIQKKLDYGTICQLALNSSQTDILVLTSDSRLLVVGVKNFEIICDCRVSPEVDAFGVTSLHWLNGLAVVSNSASGKMFFIDLSDGTILRLIFPNDFDICIEIDGLRIVCGSQIWLLTEMPSVISELNSGSSVASGIFDMFVKKDLDGIRCISSVKLSEIIDYSSKNLLLLAYESNLQEIFIDAAKFSVKVLEDQLGFDENSRHTFSYITANFKRSLMQCQMFSKLHSVGMCISPSEFDCLSLTDTILKRLCRQDIHSLAFELAVLLELDITVVLMDWIIKAIERSKQSDDDLWLTISDKLFTWANSKTIDIDYIKLTESAITMNRKKLSIKLLKLENDPRKKIELLVKLNAVREAVIESVQSGNSGVLKFVFDILVQKLSLTEFFALSNISKSVKTSLIDYCKVNNRVLLQIIMYQDDKLPELLEELVLSTDLESLEKWFQLLRIQRCFEKKYGIQLMGLSMSETLQTLTQFGPKASRDFSESIK